MAIILSIFREKFKGIIRKSKDSVIYHLPIYYKSLHKIPLSNWFQIRDGNYLALYKVKFTKHVPSFFAEIILDMVFEIENIDLSTFKKRAEVAILQSIAARTNNKSIKFKADSLAKEIADKEKKDTNVKDISLNEFINYIELTFEQIGSIDPDKISAARGLSLYHKAVEKNKALLKTVEKYKK